MSDEGYNGWKNYPTWAVHLWLDNERGSQDECLRMAEAFKRETHPRYEMAQWLKETVRESCEDPFGRGEYESSMAADLLGYALDCVDWYEIADAYFEMIEEVPA